MTEGYDVTHSAVEAAGSADSAATKALTPYVSFKTFKSLIERLDETGVPGRFDASYFTQYSGAVKSQVKITLRALGLMDADDCATDSLKQLMAAQGEDRSRLMGGIFVEHYKDALTLPENATSLQLLEVFKGRGLTGDTVNKATSFFLGMAEYTGQPVSPFFKQARAKNASKSGGVRRTRSPRIAAASSAEPRGTESADTASPILLASSEQDPKMRYVNFLMHLVEKQGLEQSGDILDRIERALGFDTGDNPG